MPDALSPRHLASRLAQIALVLVVGGLLLATLPGLGDVRERFSDARPGWVALALVLEVGSVVSFVVVFRGVFCIRMPWGFSAQVGLSEQAANVLLPAGGAGGLALGAWALNRAGMSAGHIARRTRRVLPHHLARRTSSSRSLAGLGLVTGAAARRPRTSRWPPFRPGWPLLVIAASLLLPRILPEQPADDDADPGRLGRLARVRFRLAQSGAHGRRRACATPVRCCAPAARR